MNNFKFNQRDMYKVMRTAKKIKLKELAEHLKCSISLISMYENNMLDMSKDKIRKYKKYIDEK